MKNKFFIMTIVIIAILVNTTIVTANATATVDFKTSASQVQQGESFKVTLSVACEDGINGIETTYSYDKDKLEFVNASVGNTNNWSSLSTDNQITVICNSSTKIKSADIYILTFKVKENAPAGTTAKISTTDILVDSDASSNSESTIKAQTTSVTIKAKNDASGDSQTGTNSGNTGSSSNNNGADNTENGTINNGSSSTSSSSKDEGTKTTSTSSTKDSTKTSNSKLPKTGMSTISIIIIVQVLLFSCSYVAYRKYNKYKGIK